MRKIKSHGRKISLEKYGLQGEVIIFDTTNKNSYLKINRKNEIIFSKSIFMSNWEAQNFLVMNFEKFLLKQRLKKENKPYNLDEGWVILFGKYFNLIYGGKGRKFNIIEKNIVVYGSSFELAFKNFCKHQEKELIRLAENIVENTSFKPIFKVKLLLAVWGNCNPKLNIISLNKKLIFFRKEVIEYVIHHEIAHYTHQHHQKAFWTLVGKYCPNYKMLKKELKNW